LNGIGDRGVPGRQGHYVSVRVEAEIAGPRP
jgi:hypothetical protein